MSAPSFKLQLPPRSLFKFPPDPYPQALPPPRDARTFASPFPINATLFNAVLAWWVPVTIGSVYMTSAIIMNKINRDRGNKPWPISKTKFFQRFVLLHNIFLAVFSALTFVGMIRALAHSWPGRRDLSFLGKLWPGLRTDHSLAGAADALCKLHGPRDIGDAVFYNPLKNAWNTKSRSVKLTSSKTPDPSDVGRLWNEGLAFWGWWFYLSKFYEVLDTVIILAKGKRSSTLQTYHHTGAMACMWAGIRYMSPPIWMFAFINSGIHTLMYTYYTLSALRIRVPQGIKRTLTTMQITQFLIGITFATLHLFVHYSVPVKKPFTKSVGKAVSSGASAVSAAVSGAASRVPEAAAAAVPSIGSLVKKVLLRAAGEEGMAQKLAATTGIAQLQNIVGNATDSLGANHHGTHHPHGTSHQQKNTTSWRTQHEYVPCIDTTGQAFAIWLNVFYLAPLTFLFVRFFVRSYYNRGTSTAKPSKTTSRFSKAAEDAAKGTNRELDSYGKALEDQAYELVNNGMDQIKRTTSNTKKNVQKQIDDNKETLDKVSGKVKEQAHDTKESLKKASEQLKEQAHNTKESLDRASEKAKQQVNDTKDSVDEATRTAKEQAVNVNDKSNKTNSGHDSPSKSQKRKNAKSGGKQGSTDQSVSTSQSEVSSQTKLSKLDNSESSPLQSDESDAHSNEGEEKLQTDVQEKAGEVKDALAEKASEALEGVKDVVGDVESKVENSLSESKFSDMGSFAMVDKKDLENSTAGSEKPAGKSSKNKKKRTSAAKDNGQDSAPSAADAADPTQHTEADVATNPTVNDDGAAEPSYAAVADPEKPTHVSTDTESGPASIQRSDSISSDDSKRSHSPSKKDNKSKIPQPKSRPNTSPVKKIAVTPKATASTAVHSGLALGDEHDDKKVTGNA